MTFAQWSVELVFNVAAGIIFWFYFNYATLFQKKMMGAANVYLPYYVVVPAFNIAKEIMPTFRVVSVAPSG